jgi:hypothetical protein
MGRLRDPLVGWEAEAAGGVVEAPQERLEDGDRLSGDLPVMLSRFGPPRPDGHSDFVALRTKRGAEQACFVAFDLLQMAREDWRKSPLEVRRAQLESLVAGTDAITFSEAITAEGAIVFAKACELIVSHKPGS